MNENKPESKKMSELVAREYNMDPSEFRDIIAETVMPSSSVKPAHITAFLSLAKQFELNPFSDQIHAFPHKGGVKLIVGYDGWIHIANRSASFQGMQLHESLNDNHEMVRIGCQIFRSDREHHPIIWEYMEECKRNTEPWNKFPNRMLRTKAIMQAIRAAFGTASLIDEDEAIDMGFDRHGKEIKVVNNNEDLETRLLAAAAEKNEKPILFQSGDGSIPDVQLYNVEEPKEETVIKDIETKDGTIPFEIGESPLETAIKKIGNYKRKRDLEAYLKVSKQVKWPAVFTEEQMDQLQKIGTDRLIELPV